MSSPNPAMPEDPHLNRMDGYFVCDELAVLVHRLRELICHSQKHATPVFLSSADDIYCDFLETMERGWTTIEDIAEGLER
jgi:hypothetical protein